MPCANDTRASLLLVTTIALGCGYSARGVDGSPSEDASPPDAADGGVEGGVDASRPTAATFIADYNRLLCELYVRCEPRDADALRSQAVCHPSLRRYFDHARLRAVEAGRTAFDSVAASECLSELAALSGCLELGSPSAATCGDVFRGTVPADGACLYQAVLSTECVDGLACAVGAACPGECVPPGMPGEPCTHAGCAAGTVCREGLCVAAWAVGSPCGEDPLRCAVTTYCNPESGRCEAQKDQGAPCVLTEECASEPEALLCLETRTAVRACVAPADTAEGDECFRTSFGLDSCPSPLVCAASGVGLGMCAVGAAAGEDCATDRPCGLGLRCQGGMCVPISLPGGRCGVDGTACPHSHRCLDGVCTARPVVGESCIGGECYLSECIGGVCTATAPPRGHEEPCGLGDPPCQDGLECRRVDFEQLCLPECAD